MPNELNDKILDAVRDITKILDKRDEHEDPILDTEDQEKVIRMICIVQGLSITTGD